MEQVVILLRTELDQGSISSGQEEKVTATGPKEYACLETLNAREVKPAPGPFQPQVPGRLPPLCS